MSATTALQATPPGIRPGPAAALLVPLTLAWLPMQFPLAGLPATAGAYEAAFVGEGGLVEVATAALLLPAAGFALAGARRLSGEGPRAAVVLLCVFAAACVFLMGEELSWGQHAIGWGTPDYFAARNSQSETNLHNLAGVNKSVPKWILVVGMAGASIALPAWARRRGLPGALRTGPLAPLVPASGVSGRAGAVIAGTALAAHLLEKAVARPIGLRFEDRFGVDVAENVELLIAAWLAVYAMGVWRQARPAARR